MPCWNGLGGPERYWTGFQMTLPVFEYVVEKKKSFKWYHSLKSTEYFEQTSFSYDGKTDLQDTSRQQNS